MSSVLPSFVSPDAIKIGLTLALAFFIGLEREEVKQREKSYAFGGVRSFPLIGLTSYALALLSAPGFVAWTVGFAVVGVLMALSYQHKLAGPPPAGLTTEISALAVYVLGALVQQGQYWIATTIAVLSVLLLELKKGLEGLTRYAASNEIVTVAKFLVLAGVILPVVPDRELTRFQINPFKTWLVVVAVSGISFASYLVQRLLKDRGGVLLSAVLGGAYSSTVTTVVLAREARMEAQPNLFAGSILTASGLMYARLVLLILFFNRTLALALSPFFGVLAVIGAGAGWAISRRQDGPKSGPPRPREPRNPLELRAAFLFALVFVVVRVLTHLASRYLGHAGLYALAAVMGITDVDPFIMGLTESASRDLSVDVAVSAVIVAAASNNLVKGVYALAFSDRVTGLRSFLLLVGLALLGLVPLALRG